MNRTCVNGHETYNKWHKYCEECGCLLEANKCECGVNKTDKPHCWACGKKNTPEGL